MTTTKIDYDVELPIITEPVNITYFGRPAQILEVLPFDEYYDAKGTCRVTYVCCGKTVTRSFYQDVVRNVINEAQAKQS